MKAAIGAAIAIIVIVAPTPAAGAAPVGACTATSGVTVIVDFTYFAGGEIERGCAPGHPANGLVALQAAGFSTAGTAQYGNAFVCRIDHLPAPRDEACAVTPSADAYWAYYHARASDAAWTYSAIGVLDFHPKAGSIEAFAFGAKARPGIPPDEARPPATTTTTRSPAPTTTVSAPAPPVTAAAVLPPLPPVYAPPPAHPAPTTAPIVTTVPTTAAPTTRVPRPPSARVNTTTTAARPHVVDRTAAGPVRDDDSGSPAPAILTALVVAALAAGAFLVARSRRRRTA